MTKTTKKPKGIRVAAISFLCEFDRYMKKQEVYPDRLAEARKEFMEALDAN